MMAEREIVLAHMTVARDGHADGNRSAISHAGDV